MVIFLRKKTVCLLMIIFVILSDFNYICCAKEFDDSKMYSLSYAVMDGDNGRILEGKKENEPMANASTTKILTCIIALENSDIDGYVEASKRAALQPKVRLGLMEGVEYKIKDLMYGLMLESFNDCAFAIAEYVSGSVEAFSDLMNEKAKELQCENSYFITPNGLDAEDDKGFHHTTASDLCKIMKYCCWESDCSHEFLEITQTKDYSFTDLSGQIYNLHNHNQLLNKDGVISGKTGYTSTAGYCYIMAYEKDGVKYCLALLGCGWPNNKNYKWEDARRMIEHIQNEYELKMIENDIIGTAKINENVHSIKYDLDDWNKPYNMRYRVQKSDHPKTILLNDQETLSEKLEVKEEHKYPISVNDVVGTDHFYIEKDNIENIDVISMDYIKKWNIKELFFAISYEFY